MEKPSMPFLRAFERQWDIKELLWKFLDLITSIVFMLKQSPVLDLNIKIFIVEML